MASSLLVLVVALYASVATGYVEARRRREAPPRWASLAGIVTVLVHLGALAWLAGQIGRSPFHTSGQSLSFLAFALGALYLVLEVTSHVATHGGPFFAAAAVLAAFGIPDLMTCAPAPTVLPDPLRTVHIGLALLGTAACLAGGILGIGYLGAYRRVKRREPTVGAEGPSLLGFERLSRRATALAVLFLGPSLVLGAITATRMGAPPSRIVLLAVTGVTFALLAAAGTIWWRRPLFGSLAAWLMITGTVIVLLAFGVVHPLVLRGDG